MNIAYIIGPALGGFLTKFDYQLPLYLLVLSFFIFSYFCAIITGIAFIVNCIFLGESNPRILHSHNHISNSNNKPSIYYYSSIFMFITSIFNTMILFIESPLKHKFKFDSLLILLLLFEFCVRWMVNTFDSIYGNWMMEKFDISEGLYTYFLFFAIIHKF